jgi:hypothetical protein
MLVSLKCADMKPAEVTERFGRTLVLYLVRNGLVPDMSYVHGVLTRLLDIKQLHYIIGII